MRYLYILLSIATISLCQAQVNQFARFESLHTSNHKSYLLVSNEEHGALIVMPKFKHVDKKAEVELQFLDQDLKAVWSNTISMKNTFQQRGYVARGKETYLLYQNRAHEHVIKIFKIDPKSDNIEEWETSNIVDFEILKFDIIQNTAILSGFYQQRPVVYAYNLETGKYKALPNVYRSNSTLHEIRVNADDLTFNVIVAQPNQNRDRTVVVNTYDYLGNPVRNYQVDIPNDYQILSAVSTSIRDKEQIITGVYGVNSVEVPTGIYINHIDATGQQKIVFRNFGQFDTFFDFKGDKGDKIVSKARAAAKKNKDWSYRTVSLLREVIEENDQILVSGEFFRVFGPTALDYQRLNVALFGPNPNPSAPLLRWIHPFDAVTMNDDMNVPSIQSARRDLANLNLPSDISYSHAFAFAIDLEGNVLWDGSADIGETISSKGLPKHLGDFTFHDGIPYYSYYQDEQIRTKNLKEGESTEQELTQIQFSNQTDELKFERDYASGIVRWYDDKFLVYGIQHLKDEDVRQVYFVNAITTTEGNQYEKEVRNGVNQN